MLQGSRKREGQEVGQKDSCKPCKSPNCQEPVGPLHPLTDLVVSLKGERKIRMWGKGKLGRTCLKHIKII